MDCIYRDTVPVLERHPNLPNTYIAIVCSHLLFGIAGYIRGVKWIALVDDSGFSRIWSREGESDKSEGFKKVFIDFIKKKKNIVDCIPYFDDAKDGSDRDAEAHYNLLCCLTQRVEDD